MNYAFAKLIVGWLFKALLFDIDLCVSFLLTKEKNLVGFLYLLACFHGCAYVCQCAVANIDPQRVMGWSVVCDCGLSILTCCNHLGKSVTIQESNQALGVRKAHYAQYYVRKSSNFLARISFLACEFGPIKFHFF